MRRKTLFRRALIALTATTVVTALLAPAASAAADCTWQLEHLPVQDGMSWSNLRITGVDGQGNVSGFHIPSQKDHVLARWTAAGMELVPRPDGITKFVTVAGNASGVVVACADRADGSLAVLTHAPGVGYRELPAPAGYEVWIVDDINDRGDVLGRAKRPGSFESSAVVWRADGSAPEIVAPAQVRFLRAIALGEDGAVLLNSSSGAWLWRAGALTKVPSPDSAADPRALTRDGVIFASSRGSWKWYEATGVVEAFSAPGVIESVNEDGLAVGHLDDGNRTPAVWQGTKFLSTLPLDAASGRGDVVGEGGVIAGYAGTKVVRWLCR